MRKKFGLIRPIYGFISPIFLYPYIYKKCRKAFFSNELTLSTR